jgi:hypothetical protein
MSMRKAINDKCRDCIYDSCAPGNWRQQVQACTISTCSLWAYRPKSSSAKSDVGSVQKIPDSASESAAGGV